MCCGFPHFSVVHSFLRVYNCAVLFVHVHTVTCRRLMTGHEVLSLYVHTFSIKSVLFFIQFFFYFRKIQKRKNNLFFVCVLILSVCGLALAERLWEATSVFFSFFHQLRVLV